MDGNSHGSLWLEVQGVNASNNPLDCEINNMDEVDGVLNVHRISSSGSDYHVDYLEAIGTVCMIVLMNASWRSVVENLGDAFIYLSPQR